jgi:hypothetical protein
MHFQEQTLMSLRFILSLSLVTVGFLAGCSKQQNPSSDSELGGTQSLAMAIGGGARIEKPFQQQLSGAECYSGAGSSAGNVGFGFPSRSNRVLAFSIGSLRDGLSPGQENNRAYDGAGSYPSVGIALKSPQGKILAGFGTITVNPDLQSGSFAFNDGSASGTWDCGHRL